MDGSINLKDSVTFVVKQGIIKKKIFNLFFLKNRADIYIAFPYAKVTSYRCGVMSAPKGTTKTINTDENTNASIIPVKFSYHESGQVHFKPQNPTSEIDPSVKLAEIITTPIRLFNGKHLFTIQVEGFKYFDDLSEKDERKKANVIIDMPENSEHLKVVGYAGYSDRQISYKQRDANGIYIPPQITINFTRPHLPYPLKIGMYMLHGNSIIEDKTEDTDHPYILALVGFKATPERTENLYLYAISPKP